MERLKKNYLCVTFDYNQFDEKGNSYTPGFDEMAEALKFVHKFVVETFKPDEVNLLTHSMGAIVVAHAKLTHIKKILMLAPPPRSPIDNFVELFRNRPGTELRFDKKSKLKRSWGAYTFIEPEFWIDLKKFNIEEMYKSLAKQTKLTIIRAKNDQVITDSYEQLENHPDIKLITLPGDHDFSGEAREGLLEQIESIF